MSLSFVTKRGFAVVGADATGLRTKVARLTPKGGKAQEACRQLLIAIELRWQERLAKKP
jgi:DNA-binding MarR family transcriptional regulator